MISGFMSSEKQPTGTPGGKREADVYDLLAWLEVNKKKLAVAAMVLVALGFVGATIRHFKKQKEAKANAALLALKPLLIYPTNATPPQASAFLKVAEEHSGTAAAERARILAATTLFTEGRYADAEREFARFVQELPNSPWVANAAYGVAAAQEASGKTNEAMASYQSLIAAHTDSPVAGDAKLALARMYEVRNQPEQALRLYNELTTPTPGAPPGELGNQTAFERKEALLRTNPHLDTNRVAAASPMVMPSAPANVPPTIATTNQTAPPTNTNSVNTNAATSDPAKAPAPNPE